MHPTGVAANSPDHYPAEFGLMPWLAA